MVQIQNLSPLLEALPFAVALAAILFHSRGETVGHAARLQMVAADRAHDRGRGC